MKKYLTLTLTLLFLAPMLGQAQSSDKTQEIKETIGWLNQVGLKMNSSTGIAHSISLSDDNYIDLEARYDRGGGYAYGFKDLTKMSFSSPGPGYDYNYLLKLYFEVNRQGQTARDFSYIFLSEKDARRVLKALSHLFTLLEDDFILEDNVVDKNKF